MDCTHTSATESHIECPIITVPDDADDAMIQAMERGATLADFAFIRWRATVARPVSAMAEGFIPESALTRFIEERAMGLEDAANDTDPSARAPESKARVRARTISIKRLSKRELERGRMLYPETAYDRPKTRGECSHGVFAERPCGFVSCKHHLYLDVNPLTGSIRQNFPDLEVWELPETCTLDIADRGGITLEEVGTIMNLTRERVRQLEVRGLARLLALGEMGALSDYLDNDSRPSSAIGQGHTHKGHVGIVNGLNLP